MIMTKKTILGFVILITINLFSFNSNIDSLKSKIKLIDENSISRAKLHHELGKAYLNIQEYQNALINFNKSSNIFISKNDIENAAFSLEFSGHANADMNNFDDALDSYNKALYFYRKTKNESNVAGCLCNIGILYAEKTNILSAALKYYNEALYISTKIKDSLTILKTLNNIGNLYMMNENYDKAIYYFEKSLDLQYKTKINYFIGITLNNLGNIFKKQLKYKEALKYFNESIITSKNMNDKYTVGTSLNNIGEIFQNDGSYKLAIDYFKQAKILMEEIKSDYGLHNSLIGLGYCLTGLKKHQEALEYANLAKENASHFEVIGLKRDVYALYYKVYKNIGNHKKALDYHEQFKVLNDSLHSQQKIEKIIQLELEYKYKQTLDSASLREQFLSNKVKYTSKNLEHTKRNVILTIVVFLFALIALAGIIFYLKYRNQKIISHNIAIEQELLRIQMTPHFIFNSLSVLQGMILNKEDNKSINYLSKFSKLFRIILENSREKLVLLSKEIEAVEHYLTLQNFEDNAYNFKININESLNITQFKIPPMLIQPFVENVIEHAFESNILDKKIEINLSFFENRLTCTILDNGIGIDSSNVNKNKNKNSLATTITKERLEILSKDIKIKSSIKIEDRKIYNEQGTKVTIEIPYKIVETI